MTDAQLRSWLDERIKQIDPSYFCVINIDKISGPSAPHEISFLQWRIFLMSLLELFLLAVGLSMDAFAVSVCKGLSVRRGSMKQALTVGIWFGGFQALMPFLGYLLGITFSSLITSIDHWIAFVLLAFIGFNMIREARSDEENESNDRFDFKTMLPLAVATSIDALAVGVTFAFLRVNIVPAVSFIGCITFLLSAIGLKAGNIIGAKTAPAQNLRAVLS